MRYPIRESTGASITLSRELIEQLGHPEQAEVVAEDGGLVLRPATDAAEVVEAAALLAALDQDHAASPAGIGFSEAELADLRAGSTMVEARRAAPA